MREKIRWEARISQELAEKILDKLDRRMCSEKALEAMGRHFGLSASTPVYMGTRWVRSEWESPVFGQLLDMLRRTNPYGARLGKKRSYEERTAYFAEANLVEMLKISCRNGGHPDLSGVDLSGLDLTQVSLDGVILSRPDLEDWDQGTRKGLYANLTGAMLGPDTFAKPRRIVCTTPCHGSVFHISPAGEKIRLTLFDQETGALYFYQLRDGKTFYQCGYSFPEIERPEQVADIYVNWPEQCLYVFMPDGIHFYHLFSGEKKAFPDQAFIPVPDGLSVRIARFGPDGTGMDLVYEEESGAQVWAWWKWTVGETYMAIRSREERGKIAEIAMDARDMERGRDSQLRYLLTVPDGTDEEEMDEDWVERKVYRLEDDFLEPMPDLGKHVIPCIFCGEGLGGIRDNSFFYPKKWKFWEQAPEDRVFYEEKEEFSYWSGRTVFWRTGQLRNALFGPKKCSCRIEPPPFFHASTYAAFADGAVEVNGRMVYHYVIKRQGVKCYVGAAPWDGWYVGCPGIPESGRIPVSVPET